MTNTRDIILKLKEVKKEKGLSLGKILAIMEENGDYLAKSTLSRVFADGSEDDTSFRYEETIRPIAKALLDIETEEEADDTDIKAMKSLLKYKIQRMEELEQQIEHLNALIDRQKVQFHEKADEERERFNRSIDFLKEQIAYKDKRMDLLLDSVTAKDKRIEELLTRILTCCNFKEG